MERRGGAYRSALFVLGVPAHTNPCPFPQRCAHANSFSFSSALYACRFLHFSSALRACQFLLFSSARTRIPIRILCPRRASTYQSVSFVLGAQAHTNPYPLSSARERKPIPYFFVLGARAQADSVVFVFGARAQADSVLLRPQRKREPIPYFFVLGNSLTYAPAKAEVNVGLGPERTRPGRYQRQDMVLLQTSSFP